MKKLVIAGAVCLALIIIFTAFISDSVTKNKQAEIPSQTVKSEPAETVSPQPNETDATDTDSETTSPQTEAAETNSVTPAPPPNEQRLQDDWLHADGNKILEKDGNQVWITGLNWFGYNTGTNAFDGLWSANLEDALKGIADRGFNLIRVPISVELIKNWQNGIYPEPNINYTVNQALADKNSLEIFDYTIEVCGKLGLKIMPDIHSAKTDGMGHMSPLWYAEDGSVTEEDFYSALEWLAERYARNDTVIAIDLKNEPHGAASWGEGGDNDWKKTAETAAKRVLAKNPDVLIVVEGIEQYKGKWAWWGANLRGVKDNPIDLGEFQDKLVYSPHDYGPAVYSQPWLKDGFTFDSVMKDYWRDTWYFIHEDNIAPVLIGEWGGFMEGANLSWMTDLRTLIGRERLSYTFWCYNSNSGDTGGLVLDDFMTWDEEKYAFVKEVLRQSDAGSFFGLDHAVKLGGGS